MTTDFYPTPPNVTEALLQYLSLPAGTVIWEPACGEGHMAEVLEEQGYNVISTDLHDRYYGKTGVDFLQHSMECDWIITNPPFSQSEQFIKHCIDLKKPFALLLKSQYWHSQKRRSLLCLHPPQAVLPLTWRPDFLFGMKSGSPTMEVIWTVWGETPAEQTIYAPLVKPINKGRMIV